MRNAREFDFAQLATKSELAEVKAEIAALLSEMATKSELAELKADFATLRMEVKADIAEAKTDILKWMFGGLLAQSGLIVALLKLL